MPNYEFNCLSCEHVFSDVTPVDKRDEYEKVNPCPKCGKMKLKRAVSSASFVYDRIKSPAKRAGSGWNDQLLKIKAGSGKDNTIRTR